MTSRLPSHKCTNILPFAHLVVEIRSTTQKSRSSTFRFLTIRNNAQECLHSEVVPVSWHCTNPSFDQARGNDRLRILLGSGLTIGSSHRQCLTISENRHPSPVSRRVPARYGGILAKKVLLPPAEATAAALLENATPLCACSYACSSVVV